MYIHVRNLYYMQHGIDVTVLNFNSEENYSVDGIDVITVSEYKRRKKSGNYDILVCHAPNIRYHYNFLKRYENNFPKIVFFFHGHEVVQINKIYPKPYTFVKQASRFKKLIRGGYDIIKLKLWHSYFPKLQHKSYFVFVSKWMHDQFLYWVKLNPEIIKNRYSIINNCIGKTFEDKDYNHISNKAYDFITIRSHLDGSKYSIDIVNNLAMNNPQHSFLLIGKGEIFNHIKKADNLKWINKNLSHEEIIDYLNQSRCALMPTRTDAQGLMMCEMASFGIPLITSNISVCNEVCNKLNNVELIDNDKNDINLTPIIKKLWSKVPYEKNTQYFKENTCGAEVQVLYNLLK